MEDLIEPEYRITIKEENIYTHPSGVVLTYGTSGIDEDEPTGYERSSIGIQKIEKKYKRRKLI